jgi:hypothetical protein
VNQPQLAGVVLLSLLLGACGEDSHGGPARLSASISVACPSAETVASSMALGAQLVLSPRSGLFPVEPSPDPEAIPSPLPTVNGPGFRSCHYERVEEGAPGVIRVFVYLTNARSVLDDRRKQAECLSTPEGCHTGSPSHPARGMFRADGETWISEDKAQFGGDLISATVSGGLGCVVQTLYNTKDDALLNEARKGQRSGTVALCESVSRSSSDVRT